MIDDLELGQVVWMQNNPQWGGSEGGERQSCKWAVHALVQAEGVNVSGDCVWVFSGCGEIAALLGVRGT